MKKIVITLALIVFSTSCQNRYLREKFHYRNEDELTWVNTFKAEAFYSCLKERYPNKDSIFFEMGKSDLFNLFEGIDTENIDYARSLGKKIAVQMPKPFIKIDGDEEKMRSKNFISYNCLNYYASRELDSLAKAAYKAFKKSAIQKPKKQQP